MNDIIQDVIFAWRNALKKPGTALLIIVTLALGIGVNAAMFGATYQMLLAPLPFADEERLVRLEQNGLDYYPLDGPWSDPTLNDIAAQQNTFSHLTQYTQGFFTLVGQGDPHLAVVGIVSADFFEMLSVEPMLGRGFDARDAAEGAEPVLLLSHEFWQNKFGADPAVVGRSMEMFSIVYRVIGVLPEMPPWPHTNDVWLPVASDPFRLLDVVDVASNRANGYILQVFGKLRAGVALEQAGSELNAIARRLTASYPDVYTQDYALTPRLLRDEMQGDSARLLLLPALALLVMLIAIANVANLQLANLMARSQELAVREALGASPGRIRRLLMTESLLFALGGGALGLVIAGPTSNLLANYAAGFTPLAQLVGIDSSTVLLILLLALGSGALSAVLASLRSRDINLALKEGGDKVTTSTAGIRRGRLLLITQFALAFVVLTSSVLIVSSLFRLNAQDAGFRMEGVLQMSMLIDLSSAGAQEETRTHLRNFWQQLRSRVDALPGVQASGYLNGSPLLENANWLRDAAMEVADPTGSMPAQPLDTRLNFASEGYFATMEIPLLRGRMFATTDADATPVALINATLAERYFPGGDPLGKLIRFAGATTGWTIVGVVGNVRSRGLDREEEPAFYFYQQTPNAVLNLYVRSSGDLDELARAVTAIVHEIDPRQSVRSVIPLDDIRSRWLAPVRLRSVLTALFGLLALVVTLSGVIGVVSYNVNRRVREIGVHMAVGASPAQVRQLFAVATMKVYLAGLALGLALMLAVAPLLDPLLYEITARDARAYLYSTLALTLAVCLAMYFPARRAGALSPVEALHCE